MAKTLYSIFFILVTTLSASAQESDNVILKQALKFLGTPYVAHTLEVNEQEQLIINCNEVDCTTFVEYVLALALSPIEHDTVDTIAFARNLQRIRYRNGQINGYPSRLHYIADWVNNGVRHGFIEDVAALHSPDTLTLSLSFMSSHPQSYKQLANSPENVREIKEIEKSLSGSHFHYIPKSKLPDTGLPWIKDGDIIAITTNIPGLDVSHLGFALHQDGQLKLLHASSTGKKVLISTGSLSQMLKKNKRWTGIRVLRMKRYYSQKDDLIKNQLNSMKRKEGLWIDTIHSVIRETYYKNGIESGTFKQYNLERKLLVMGEYCEGKMCGTWYFFEATGHLLFLLKDFSVNIYATTNEENGQMYVPDYKCYSISYYPNGNIKNEGLLLWAKGQTPESDLSREYGEWKYYNESGKLVSTKYFK